MKKYIKQILFSILFLSILFLFYYLNHPILNVKNKTFECGDTIQLKATDFIDSSSKNIDSDQVKLKCDYENKVGKYKVKLTYKNIEKEAILYIKDTTSPVFIDFSKELTIYTNEDILSHFQAEDLNKVTISIKEDIDTSKTGTYKIHVQAIDAYQNKTTKVCTLNIISKNEQTIPSSSENTNQNKSSSDLNDSPSYTDNSNQQEQIYSQDSQNQQTVQPDVSACPYSGSVGNSGMTFGSYSEATSWANTYLMNNVWTYSSYSIEQIGCPDIWTVSFY